MCVCNYNLHAATSPCQCSGYHRDGISVNHLLPLLSDRFVSSQLATVSSLFNASSFAVHMSYLLVFGTQEMTRGAGASFASVCARGGSEVI